MERHKNSTLNFRCEILQRIERSVCAPSYSNKIKHGSAASIKYLDAPIYPSSMTLASSNLLGRATTCHSAHMTADIKTGMKINNESLRTDKRVHTDGRHRDNKNPLLLE